MRIEIPNGFTPRTYQVPFMRYLDNHAKGGRGQIPLRPVRTWDAPVTSGTEKAALQTFRLIGLRAASTGDACELPTHPVDAGDFAIQYRLPAVPAVTSGGAFYKNDDSSVKSERVTQPVVVPTEGEMPAKITEPRPCYECKVPILIVLMVDKGKWWAIDPQPDPRDGWILLNWDEEHDRLEGHTLTGDARKEYRTLPQGDRAPLHRPHFQTCQGEKAKAQRAAWQAAHPRKGSR